MIVTKPVTKQSPSASVALPQPVEVPTHLIAAISSQVPNPRLSSDAPVNPLDFDATQVEGTVASLLKTTGAVAQQVLGTSSITETAETTETSETSSTTTKASAPILAQPQTKEEKLKRFEEIIKEQKEININIQSIQQFVDNSIRVFLSIYKESEREYSKYVFQAFSLPEKLIFKLLSKQHVKYQGLKEEHLSLFKEGLALMNSSETMAFFSRQRTKRPYGDADESVTDLFNRTSREAGNALRNFWDKSEREKFFNNLKKAKDQFPSVVQIKTAIDSTESTPTSNPLEGKKLSWKELTAKQRYVEGKAKQIKNAVDGVLESFFMVNAKNDHYIKVRDELPKYTFTASNSPEEEALLQSLSSLDTEYQNLEKENDRSYFKQALSLVDEQDLACYEQFWEFLRASHDASYSLKEVWEGDKGAFFRMLKRTPEERLQKQQKDVQAAKQRLGIEAKESPKKGIFAKIKRAFSRSSSHPGHPGGGSGSH